MADLYIITFVNAVIEMDIDGVPYIIEIPYATTENNVTFKKKHTDEVIRIENCLIIGEYETDFCSGLAELLLGVVQEWKEKKKK